MDYGRKSNIPNAQMQKDRHVKMNDRTRVKRGCAFQLVQLFRTRFFM